LIESKKRVKEVWCVCSRFITVAGNIRTEIWSEFWRDGYFRQKISSSFIFVSKRHTCPSKVIHGAFVVLEQR